MNPHWSAASDRLKLPRSSLAFFVLFLALTPAAAGAAGGTPELIERLGEKAAVGTSFADEAGRPVVLSELMKKPTIIAPVYLSCTHSCPILLAGLAETLPKVDMKPVEDYNVITISFDETDTPALAAEKRRNYLRAVGGPFPEEGWRFLTGDAEGISRFMKSVGFSFRRGRNGFSHPVTLIVLSADGRIVRYLTGASFLPFDVTMALTEASKGRVGSAARRVTAFCYSYDPDRKSYVFDALKVTAATTVFVVLIFLSFLALPGKRR